MYKIYLYAHKLKTYLLVNCFESCDSKGSDYIIVNSWLDWEALNM